MTMAHQSEPPPAGGEGGDPSSDPVELRVVQEARAAAPQAIKAIVDLVANPKRGGGTVLAAATMVLNVAGVRIASEDQRQLAQLKLFKKRLSRAAYAEVLNLYADDLGVEPAPQEDA